MTARHDYERYLRARHRPAHGRRTAERWAGFLLPHLRPGMRLLDLGCGPGSITTGLAAGLAAVGVDVDPVPVESVPVAAADAAALPFPDASFDALFANALLQHVPDPLAVLREARRFERSEASVTGHADGTAEAAPAAAWDRWGDNPGAFAARFWVTALAWAPVP